MILFFINSILSNMLNNSSVTSPLPKITVQKRFEKVNLKITQMIKKLGKRREMQILQQRSQGFWMQDEVKISLDRIKLRTHRIKTMPYTLKSLQFTNLQNKRHKTMQKSNVNKKRLQNKFHLPELKQMILNRQNESSKLITAKRRKIIHLLILGLNRRNLGKLYQALDIVLLASFYFEKDDEERVLKSICLSLISKLHREIMTQKLSLNRKSKLNKKRKSLTVVNYLTRENFMENFMMKLRKTKLVGEFSYSDNKKHENNVKKINAKCQVVVPRPQQIFQPQLGVTNYDYVAITVDDHTNSFPYQYPKSLSQKIEVIEWRQMICKLNGLLIPQSKCYSFSSIVKLFYLPFILIFILMLTFSVFRTVITNQIGRFILIVSTVLLVTALAIKVNVEESGYTNYIQIKDKMKEYLAEWEDKYSGLNLKFRMGENIDAIFIAFPSQDPDSSQTSSKLTQIEQVDQNNTQNYTESKAPSMKGMRRTGNRFEESGNIMKKRTCSKFANSEQKPFKRQNTMKSSEKDQEEEKNGEGRARSEKKVEKEEIVDAGDIGEVYDGFMYTSEVRNVKNRAFKQIQIKSSLFNEQNPPKDQPKQPQMLQQQKQRTFIYKPEVQKQIQTPKVQQSFLNTQKTQRNKQSQNKLPLKRKTNLLGRENNITNHNLQYIDRPTLYKNGIFLKQSSTARKKEKEQHQISESYLITPQSLEQNM